MDFITGDKEMRQEFMIALADLAAKDSRIVFLDSDLASSSGSGLFRQAHPDRFFNCGIMEANMVGVAAGLSAGGFVPFVHSFAAFMSRRTADQIFMSCAYARQNVRLIGSDPGVCGSANGGTHMALEDIAIMRAIPGITILDASDPGMQRQALKKTLDKPGVYYFRLTRKVKTRLYPESSVFTIGKAHLAADHGRDATIITAGFTGVMEALKAAEALLADGVAVRVLDLFTIAPADEAAILTAAEETGGIVTVDNHSLNGGIGSIVAEVIAGKKCLPFRRLGAATFGEVGTQEYIMDKFGIDAAGIRSAVRELVRSK